MIVFLRNGFVFLVILKFSLVFFEKKAEIQKSQLFFLFQKWFGSGWTPGLSPCPWMNLAYYSSHYRVSYFTRDYTEELISSMDDFTDILPELLLRFLN